MEIRSTGIVLGATRHAENHALVDIFTHQAGRVRGLVHGGQGRAKQALLQPGNEVMAVWYGRTQEALGRFTLELTIPRAGSLLMQHHALVALQSVCSLCVETLGERDAQPALFEATQILLGMLEEPLIWPALMARWELGLLAALGHGLALEVCVATGQRLEDGANLTFVSPKSGGAVIYEAGVPFQDKMLPLPPFLIDRGEPNRGDVAAALRLTAFFIEARICSPADKALPDARRRLSDWVARWVRG